MSSIETKMMRADLLHRPLYSPTKPGSTQPLVVTPTLVSRVDDTAWSVRPHDPGSTRGHDGKEVTHPEKHPDRLAIEPDPNLAYERWDEYWRKIHGPKFAYEEPSSTSQWVLRYDQVHRLPSGPSSFFRPPYLAMTDSSGKLVSDPFAKVPGYRRPCWDGFAYIAYASEEDIRKTLQQEKFAKRIVADEQVAFRMVTRQMAKEYILIPSAQHRDPISLVKIHHRQPTLSREEFQQRWLQEHADFVLSRTATHTYVRRYAQLHTLGSTQEDPEGSKIDGLSVLGLCLRQ